MKRAAYTHVARLARALASPSRLELVELLCQGEKAVETLAKEARLSVANTSRHLQILRGAGLVQLRREGRWVVYRLSDPDVAELFVRLRHLAEKVLPDVERTVRAFVAEWKAGRPIHPRTLRRRLRRGDVVLVDVRPPEEYRAGHILGAVSIPLPELEQRLHELPRDKVVVAYCRGPYCAMALEAVRLLRSHGYRAYRLTDSVHDWRLHGGEVEAGDPAA